METNEEQRQASASVDDEPPKPLAQIIGQRLKDAREEAGIRQADVAEAAKRLGLRWGRSSVAALESGARNLSVEELALLPFIAVFAGLDEVDFVRDHDKVYLTEERFAQGRDFRRFFINRKERQALSRDLMARKKGLAPNLSEEMLEAFPLREELEPQERLGAAQDDLQVVLWRYFGEVLWPRVGSEKADILAHGPWSELDRKIADRVFASPPLVILMAHSLWGRPAADERDARAEMRSPGASRRALQTVRGHVARELIEEIDGEWDVKREKAEYMLEQVQWAKGDVYKAEELIDSLSRQIEISRKMRERSKR